jgi:hypothetical protein
VYAAPSFTLACRGIPQRPSIAILSSSNFDEDRIKKILETGA